MQSKLLLLGIIAALSAGAAAFQGGKLLIIAEDSLVGAVQPLADWACFSGREPD
jgi:hypothetical protein